MANFRRFCVVLRIDGVKSGAEDHVSLRIEVDHVGAFDFIGMSSGVTDRAGRQAKAMLSPIKKDLDHSTFVVEDFCELSEESKDFLVRARDTRSARRISDEVTAPSREAAEFNLLFHAARFDWVLAKRCEPTVADFDDLISVMDRYQVIPMPTQDEAFSMLEELVLAVEQGGADDKAADIRIRLEEMGRLQPEIQSIPRI